MGIESALYDHLADDAPIAALVVARIYPSAAPQNVTAPYVTFAAISGEHDSYVGGGGGLAEVNVQIDVWAETSASRRAVLDAIFVRLHGWRGAMGAELFPVRSVEFSGTVNSFERPTAGDEPGIYRGRVDARVWHAETATNV